MSSGAVGDATAELRLAVPAAAVLASGDVVVRIRTGAAAGHVTVTCGPVTRSLPTVAGWTVLRVPAGSWPSLVAADHRITVTVHAYADDGPGAVDIDRAELRATVITV